MTGNTSKATRMALVTVIHLVCCGLPLFLLSGGSIAFLIPSWPVATGSVAALAAMALVWRDLRRRGCDTCPAPQFRRSQ